MENIELVSIEQQERTDRKEQSPKVGRPRLKPDFDSREVLQHYAERAAAEYQKCEKGRHPSLAEIGEKIDVNPIKVRKLLITAGVYQSNQAALVQQAFDGLRKKLPYKQAVLATAAELQLSKASVNSYLPYEKVVYLKQDCNTAQLSVEAERMRHYRSRKIAVQKLQEAMQSGMQLEERLWGCIVKYQKYPFYTASGLPFSYTLKKGRHGEYTKELWVSRTENSKPLVWSSVWMAFQRAIQLAGEVERPKAIGNIRGISYLYPILWRVGVIAVPDKIARKMREENQDKESK